MLRPSRSVILRSKTPVQKHTFSYLYDTQTIHFEVWSKRDNEPITTIIFLGTVQVGKLPAWIAQHSSQGTAVVQGAPHWFAKEDGSDIIAFMHRFTEEAFKAIVTHYHTDKTMRIIADSQATPGVLWVLHQQEYLHLVTDIILLQPLGLNAAAYSGTVDERLDLFKKRIAQNLRHQVPSLLSDRRLRYNHRQILKNVGYNNPKSNAQYAAGLTANVLDDLKRFYTLHKDIAIICGASDMMFPPHEIQETLRRGGLDIPFVTISGVPHAPLATRQGMKLLRAAFDYTFSQQGAE